MMTGYNKRPNVIRQLELWGVSEETAFNHVANELTKRLPGKTSTETLDSKSLTNFPTGECMDVLRG